VNRRAALALLAQGAVGAGLILLTQKARTARLWLPPLVAGDGTLTALGVEYARQ